MARRGVRVLADNQFARSSCSPCWSTPSSSAATWTRPPRCPRVHITRRRTRRADTRGSAPPRPAPARWRRVGTPHAIETLEAALDRVAAADMPWLRATLLIDLARLRDLTDDRPPRGRRQGRGVNPPRQSTSSSRPTTPRCSIVSAPSIGPRSAARPRCTPTVSGGPPRRTRAAGLTAVGSATPVTSATPSTNTPEQELARLAKLQQLTDLHRSGTLSDAEYEAAGAGSADGSARVGRHGRLRLARPATCGDVAVGAGEEQADPTRAGQRTRYGGRPLVRSTSRISPCRPSPPRWALRTTIRSPTNACMALPAWSGSLEPPGSV